MHFSYNLVIFTRSNRFQKQFVELVVSTMSANLYVGDKFISANVNEYVNANIIEDVIEKFQTFSTKSPF